MNKPLLTEPGVKNFLHRSLIECKNYKNNYYSTMFNIIILLLFVLGITLLFIYRYNGGISKQEINSRNRKKQEYIFKKLQQLSTNKKNENLITDLPVIHQNHPELNIINRKIF